MSPEAIKAYEIDEGIRWRERIIKDRNHLERLKLRVHIDEANMFDRNRPLWKPPKVQRKWNLKFISKLLP